MLAGAAVRVQAVGLADISLGQFRAQIVGSQRFDASTLLLQPAKTGQRLCGGPSASHVMLRVGLRHVTGHVTGRMHKIPRVYRGPYGFTGKMTPGSVYWRKHPVSRTLPDWQGGVKVGS
jgi:ribosomal protein S5